MKTEMNNTEFTKGPWEVGKHNEIRSINGTMVAIVLEHVPDIMIEANAKLIAAAPDLLYALELLLNVYRSDGSDDFYNIDHEEVAMNAINKATL